MRIGLMSVVLVLGGCAASRGAREAPAPRAASVLAGWMAGEFSNRAQAAADRDFDAVEMVVAPIWPESERGEWLYVEQARAGMRDRPYRQRVYRLRDRDEGGVRIEVYLLPDPKSFVNAWADAGVFDGLASEDLVLVQGCDLVVKRVDHAEFAGGTEGRNCASTVQGATFAEATLRATPREIEVWERGFDASGKQVWGEDGPHVFERER